MSSIYPQDRTIRGGLFRSIVLAAILSARLSIALGQQAGGLDLGFNPAWATDDPALIHAVAVQSDGKILVSGVLYGSSPTVLFTRLNPDGSVDPEFNPGTGPSSGVRAIMIRPDGKILIGGDFTFYNGSPRHRLALLNADGSIDTSFGTGTGVGSWDSGSFVSAIALQQNGKILIGGQFPSYDGVDRLNLARLNQDGSLDGSFAPGSGLSASGGNGGPYVYSIIPQTDGKSLWGGRFDAFNGVSDHHAIRLNDSGDRDTNFDSNPVGWFGAVNNMALQSDGKITLGGLFFSHNHLVRLNPDGSHDTSFDSGFDSSGSNEVYSLALQPDDKAIVGGMFLNYDGMPRCGIALVNTDGSIDPTFDPGAGVTGADGAAGRIHTLAIQPDGKILAGGWFTHYDGIARPGIARIHGSFGTGFHEAHSTQLATYPNPFTDAFSIQPANAQPVRVIIYDPQGKLVHDEVLNTSKRIDLSGLSNGAYTAFFWQDLERIHRVTLVKQ